MGITWTSSADKHGVSREDAWHVIRHPSARQEISGEPGWVTMVFVGPRHLQALPDDNIEVMVSTRGTDFKIFHAMPLTDKYRHLLT